MRSIEEIRKDLAIHLYGRTKEEAQQAHVCINCGQEIFWGKQSEGRQDEGTKPGGIYSYAGIREYRISGMCEHCFDELMGGGN